MELEFSKVTQFQCRLTDLVYDLNGFITEKRQRFTNAKDEVEGI